VSIPIAEENIVISKFSIAKNSKEKENFIKDVSYIIKNIDVSDLSDSNKLEDATNSLVIRQKCGQTLGLGLGQSKDIVVVFY